VLVLSSTLFWVARASSYPSEKVVVLIISGELNRSKGNFLGGFKLTVSRLFIFLLIINFIGLVPNVFSPTRHLVLTLSFGFII
jgi:F0F1-type ATP synthase membrane subunit a